jgi:hypothetical protein
MKEWDIQVGLRVPEKEGEIPAFRTCNEMREMIFKQSRDSALIHNAWIHADMSGLSGEDRYTFMAFHALIAMEHYFRRNMDMMNRMPNPPIFFKDPT